MHDDERRERREDQPRVPVPERGQRDAENREHEVDRHALDAKEAALAEVVAAAELEDHREDDVVQRDEDDAGGEPGDGEARVRIRDRACCAIVDEVCRPPRRQSVQRVVRDVEALDRPRVALLQPLRNRLHERDQHDQLGRKQERRCDEKDDRGVVHLVPRRLDRERVRDRGRNGEHDERDPAVVHVRDAEIELAGGRDGGDGENREIDLRAARQPAADDRLHRGQRVVDDPSRQRFGDRAHRAVPVHTGTVGRRAMPALSEERALEASPVRTICSAWLQRTAGPRRGPPRESG